MNQTHPLPASALKLILGLFLSLVASLVVVACSDFKFNRPLPTPGPAKGVTVGISDSVTCQAPNGPYSHVYVTIADIRANYSESAENSDGGWVDLTPNLSAGPMQVDILAKADGSQCFLAILGNNPDVTPGTYKQIRVFLSANNATVTANACGSSASCVVLASDSSVHPLEISAEATNGIKLTTKQILSTTSDGAGFTILADNGKYLDINFLACESIIRDERRGFRLKPVVYASEAKSSPHLLHGKVLDGGTGQPVKGSVLVALNRQDGTGVSKVVRTTLVEADGSFVFCPRPTGAYDLVIVGTSDDGSFYEPSIFSYVPGGTSDVGEVKVYPVAPSYSSMVTLTGKLTSQNGSLSGTTNDVTLSVLEKIPSAPTFAIPMPRTSTQSSATLLVTTAAPNSNLSCPTNSYCADYSIQVPAGSANYADFEKRSHLTTNSMLPTYVIDGVPYIPASGSVVDCNFFPFRTQPFMPSAPGVTVQVPTLRFTHCQ